MTKSDTTATPARCLAVLDGLICLLGAVVIAAAFGLYLGASRLIWVNLLTDDAYYYLGFARHLAETGVSRYALPFVSNGYQPLWTWLLTCLAFVFGTSDLHLSIECYALAVLATISFVYLAKTRHGAAFPAVLVSLLFFGVMLLGMESVLIPSLFILFMAARDWKLRGMLVALLFLSRLDALAIVLARDLVRLIFRREIDLRPYVVIGPVVAAYLAYNYLSFGVPVPVSGLIKSVNAGFLENYAVGFGYIVVLKQAAVLLVLSLGLKLIARKSVGAFRYGQELSTVAICVVVCAGYYGANSGWGIWAWYLWAPLLLTYYLAQEIVQDARDLCAAGRGRIAFLTCGFVVVLFGFTGAREYPRFIASEVLQALDRGPVQSTFASRNVELADWVKANPQIPHDAMFAMGDRAGSFGLFLGDGYRFFHAEGLVGPIDYYRAMKTDAGLSFVDKLGVNYWVADREQFLTADGIIGVAEPVQISVMHRGPYLLCFRTSAVLLDQSYTDTMGAFGANHEIRYLLDMAGRVTCPDAMLAQFTTLRDTPGGLRDFSLVREHSRAKPQS